MFSVKRLKTDSSNDLNFSFDSAIKRQLRRRLVVVSSSPLRRRRSEAGEEGRRPRGMESMWARFAVSLLLSVSVAGRALKRKSVDFTAIFVGIPVMVIHMLAGYRFGGLLLAFFSTSSKVTRIGEDKKRGVDAEFKEGGQRNWIQVLTNSGIATILVVLLARMTDGQDRCLDTKESSIITGLLGGIVGHYACCNGDTWSSELGMLSSAQPHLITSFKKVRKGTNGAITIYGLLAATTAGFVIGLAFVLIGLLTTSCSADVALRQLLVVPISAAAGLCGSLIDSLLGATLQFSGYCTVRKKVVSRQGPTVIKITGANVLDNNGVNAVSVLLTTLLTSIICLYVF